jgi:ribosomal protein L4
MKEPKTKKVFDFLKSRALEGKRVLFLGDKLHEGVKEENGSLSPAQKFETLIRSIRNIPETDFMLVPNVSGYDIIASRELVVMDSALDQLKVILRGHS